MKQQMTLERTEGMERLLKGYSERFVQKHGTADLADCIDAAPSLQMIATALDRDKVVMWLADHLKSLGDFSGARRTLDNRQMTVLAEILYNEYGWINVRELMVFFYRLKLGRYAMTYGSFDPGVVMRSIRTFLGERMAAIHEVEDRRQRQELHADRSKCVSYDEYRRMLTAGELDHLMTPEQKEFFANGGSGLPGLPVLSAEHVVRHGLGKTVALKRPRTS